MLAVQPHDWGNKSQACMYKPPVYIDIEGVVVTRDMRETLYKHNMKKIDSPK